MDRIAHFGHFREHDGCPATYQKIGCITDRRVGRYARKRIAAAALHADYQLRSRTGFALALVELCQVAFGHLQNIGNHRLKADVFFILQADDAGAVDWDTFHIVSPFQQALRLEFFAAEANNHHFTAEVRVQCNIVDCTNRHDGGWGIDRHAAAVQVIEPHHAVDVWVFGQQIALNDFHYIIHHARHAVHAGGDSKQVFGADATVSIAVSFEGITLKRRQRLWHFGRQR